MGHAQAAMGRHQSLPSNQVRCRWIKDDQGSKLIVEAEAMFATVDSIVRRVIRVDPIWFLSFGVSQGLWGISFSDWIQPLCSFFKFSFWCYTFPPNSISSKGDTTWFHRYSSLLAKSVPCDSVVSFSMFQSCYNVYIYIYCKWLKQLNTPTHVNFHRSSIQKHIKHLKVMNLKQQILNAATRNLLAGGISLWITMKDWWNLAWKQIWIHGRWTFQRFIQQDPVRFFQIWHALTVCRKNTRHHTTLFQTHGKNMEESNWFRTHNSNVGADNLNGTILHPLPGGLESLRQAVSAFLNQEDSHQLGIFAGGCWFLYPQALAFQKFQSTLGGDL